jgi:signal transduction histidine kinase
MNATDAAPSTVTSILIVEDSSTQAMLLQNVLGKGGYDGFIARNGEEALHLVQERRPAAVITDINMPGMDGYELCRLIKTDPKLWEIPVILLTSLSSPQDIIRGLECCADNFIMKPYSEPDLLHRLRFSLDHRGDTGAPCADPPISIDFGGSHFTITAGRAQILYFLLSTYQTAVEQNKALTDAREQLEVSAAELARSNTDLEQFGYIVSHDLQEPLRMVTSFLGLLQKHMADRLDDTAKEFIAFADDGAKRMKLLIQDLLAYSRVGTRGGAFAQVNLTDVFETITANLRIAIDECGATITHDPLPVLTGDATQLTQLFQNLVGNALKFRGQRPPVIHVSAVKQDKHWLFGVRDNGIGIDPQFFDRIFAVFQRLHTREQYAGTGIGLSICKKIVERHGGRIWVESTPGEGTTFFFTILAAAPQPT